MTKKHVWRVKKEYFRQLKSGEKSLEIRVGYDFQWSASHASGNLFKR